MTLSVMICPLKATFKARILASKLAHFVWVSHFLC